MKILMLLLIASILAACAAPEHRPAPDWSDAELSGTQVTDPAQLPILCPIEVITGEDGERYGTWSLKCWEQFEAFEIVAEGNTEIAGANADALRATEQGYNSLIKAGEMQQKMSEYFEDQYKEEKKERWIDTMIYRILIGLGLIAVAL